MGEYASEPPRRISPEALLLSNVVPMNEKNNESANHKKEIYAGMAELEELFNSAEAHVPVEVS